MDDFRSAVFSRIFGTMDLGGKIEAKGHCVKQAKEKPSRNRLICPSCGQRYRVGWKVASSEIGWVAHKNTTGKDYLGNSQLRPTLGYDLRSFNLSYVLGQL